MGQKVYVSLSPDNEKWIKEMKKRGVSRSSIVNLAIDILKPKIHNIGASDESIRAAALTRIISDNGLDY